MRKLVVAIIGGTVVLLGIGDDRLARPGGRGYSSGTGNSGDRVPLGAACFAGIQGYDREGAG